MNGDFFSSNSKENIIVLVSCELFQDQLLRISKDERQKQRERERE